MTHVAMQDAIEALHRRHGFDWLVLGGRNVMQLAVDIDCEPTEATQVIADLLNNHYLEDAERFVEIQDQLLPRVCLRLTPKAQGVLDRRAVPAP